MDDETVEVAMRDAPELREIAAKARERLNEEHPDEPWWADVVFFLHDTAGMCRMVANLGYGELAEVMGETCGVTMERLVGHIVMDDERLQELLPKLLEDAKTLSASLVLVTVGNGDEQTVRH